jgi:hypothetical protein
MKGFLTVALIAAGFTAVMAVSANAAGRVPFYDTKLFADTPSLSAPDALFAGLADPATRFSDLQVDPTGLPPRGAALLTSNLVGADLTLAPRLHFDLAAAPSSAALFPGYGAAGDDNWQSKSLLAGVNWDFAQWGGVGLTASHDNYFVMSSDRPSLASVSRVENDTLGVSAHLGLGGGWVTTASYNEGLTQLDLRPSAPDAHTQSYTIAIAKHGLFGDDALGFSFSQPAKGPANNDLANLVASGSLPPVYAGNSHFTESAPESDFQLGYVTSYLNGALALQTTAAYQVNVQGQSGANALTMLSRAKIKF